ncbi:peptidylprolyl isomerase [Yoonia sediminilitoris]|uniref:Parvulin-like PPIase n=1 Tax=Yoonia sediminilitoris TaxID=1286148 RepID=A0A2T6KCT7_9RHOB|nr:peptidylprolyl isomerase [Yoonia sediminilitoris]PUB12755.1 periplasmic chaperone for outer membrane proteins SurA [Yoonia sediminilitoris]RCW94234.1 periplasmic chaperone for outer membrane proteins SurA [Yoonia sediminilitoris]
MRARLTFAAFLAFILSLTSLGGAQAQGQFAPVITVNDRVITQFELSQRILLLELFRTPGDLNRQAREGLIEDRLKQQEMDRVGLSLTDEALNTALEEFAGRANQDLDSFNRFLQQNGIAPETLRDFVKVGVSWRDYIRTRFGRQVTITDNDIERAIAQRGNRPTAIKVLLSEIIIPAPPDRAREAQATAERISRLRSFASFEAAAREVSALPSRDQGGRLGWLPITNYPPQLRQLLLDLRPGEVTEPITITNGVALFQMRGIREVAQSVSPPVSIDYAAYYIAGGQSAAALQTAQEVANRADTCDDLYGIARNQPAEVLDRSDVPPADIPGDVALELARLDPGEISTNLTRDNGNTLVLLMLCSRTAAGQAGADPDAVRNQIRSQRLGGFADALLSDLRAAAVIETR